MLKKTEFVRIISALLVLISFGSILFISDIVILYLLKQKKIKIHDLVAATLNNTRIYNQQNHRVINKKNVFKTVYQKFMKKTNELILIK